MLIVPGIEAGNILVKLLTHLAHAEAAGLVLGAPVPPAGRHGQAAATSGTRPAGWALVDAAGDALPLIGSEVDRWQLLALTGGHPWPVFGELSSQGLRPTSVVIDGTLVTL